MTLTTGQVLNNRYRIVKLLGQGGFGAVYRVWDLNMETPRALKENLETSQESQRQFKREAKMLGELVHPNLPRVIDHFIVPEMGQYLVMDYVEGQDLRDIMDESTVPLPEAQVLEWFDQVADALEYLHAHIPPIIHRDIKPANIRITPSGKAMLVDFGIAKIYDPELSTTAGARAVTPGYSPQEQYGVGTTDVRTDIYAIGATMYHLLTAKQPPESIQRNLGAALNPPQIFNPEISARTGNAILKAMEMLPEDRYQSISQFTDALAADTEFVAPAVIAVAPAQADQPEPVQIRPEPLPEPEGRKFNWWILFGALALVVIIVVFGGFMAYRIFFESLDEGTPVSQKTATRPPTKQPTATTDYKATQAFLSRDEFICDDPLGCVSYMPDMPVLLASALVISGPNTDLGLDSQYGVEVAIDFKEEVWGHRIELQAEDDGCSAEGGQTAGQKIVSNPSIVAVVGTSCSGAGVPMSKVISDAGYVMVSPSNTSPALTNPDMHQPGYLRTSHNDKVQGKAMAEFAFNELGVRTAAVIHDGDPYTEGLASVFAESFTEIGGEVVAFTAVNKGDVDMRPVLTSVAAAGPPEFLYYPVFTAEGGFLTKQAKEVAGLENTILAAADGMISSAAIEAVGEAGEGMYFSGPDLSFSGDLYNRFLEYYESKFGTLPLSVFHAHAFDATNMILSCVEAVGVLEADGTLHIPRMRLRECLFGTRGFEGITGVLTCDDFGDCADAKISVSQLQNGQYVRIWP